MRKLVFVTLALAGLMLGAVYLCLPTDPINRTTCEKIKEGMSETEVIRVVGRRWDFCEVFSFHEEATWCGRNGHLEVTLAHRRNDESGVAHAEFKPSPSWWERMRKGWVVSSRAN